MTLDQMANVASVIASIAVVLTIPVLIISIRQNTKAQRAIVVDNLAAGIASINVPLTQDPEIGSALQATSQDWNSATREQRIRAHYFYYSIFKLYENAWYQMRAGILEPEVWEGWAANMAKSYYLPGVRDVWWPARKHSYTKAFRDYLATTEPTVGENIGNYCDIFGEN